MNRQETIQVLLRVNQGAPNYFRNMNSEQKNNVVNEWASAFMYENFSTVLNSVEIFFKNGSKFAPFPSEIQKIIKDEKAKQMSEYEKRWYEHFPQDGPIEYNDEDVAWAEWEDWNHLPLELAKRMEYVPDPNDEIRNALLKQCLEIQAKGRGEIA